MSHATGHADGIHRIASTLPRVLSTLSSLVYLLWREVSDHLPLLLTSPWTSPLLEETETLARP